MSMTVTSFKYVFMIHFHISVDEDVRISLIISITLGKNSLSACISSYDKEYFDRTLKLYLSSNFTFHFSTSPSKDNLSGRSGP